MVYAKFFDLMSLFFTFFFEFESDTRLDTKVYDNHTDDGGTFEVKDGKIRGTIPARKVVVLY